MVLYDDVWYDSEGQSRPSCVMLNSTEKQTSMEVCEETTRGVPRCGKYGWQHEKIILKSQLLSGFRFLSVGLMFGRWALSPTPGKLTHFLSRQELELFFSETISERSFSPCIIML